MSDCFKEGLKKISSCKTLLFAERGEREEALRAEAVGIYRIPVTHANGPLAGGEYPISFCSTQPCSCISSSPVPQTTPCGYKLAQLGHLYSAKGSWTNGRPWL